MGFESNSIELGPGPNRPIRSQLFRKKQLEEAGWGLDRIESSWAWAQFVSIRSSSIQFGQRPPGEKTKNGGSRMELESNSIGSNRIGPRPNSIQFDLIRGRPSREQKKQNLERAGWGLNPIGSNWAQAQLESTRFNLSQFDSSPPGKIPQKMEEAGWGLKRLESN